MASMIALILQGFVFLLVVTAWAQDTREQENLSDMPDATLKGQIQSAAGDTVFRELKSYLDTQRWQEAKSLAEQLVAGRPQEPFPHFCLGFVLLRQQDKLAAIRCHEPFDSTFFLCTATSRWKFENCEEFVQFDFFEVPHG